MPHFLYYIPLNLTGPYLTIVSVEVNIPIYCLELIEGFTSLLDNELDRKIDVTAILFLLVQNRQKKHITEP